LVRGRLSQYLARQRIDNCGGAFLAPQAPVQYPIYVLAKMLDDLQGISDRWLIIAIGSGRDQRAAKGFTQGSDC
jgi:hypothetical protein